MARWTPDAAERLQHAAMALFVEQSFEEVTVAAIATRAGLTERTFFRHFATKEDVLFGDGPAILDAILGAVRSAPDGAAPRDVFDAVGQRLGSVFENQRAYHRLRTKVLSDSPALLERDLLKQTAWSQAVANELVSRGVSPERAAVLSAACTATFRIVYGNWSTDRRKTSLVERLNDALDTLSDDLGPT